MVAPELPMIPGIPGALVYSARFSDSARRSDHTGDQRIMDDTNDMDALAAGDDLHAEQCLYAIVELRMRWNRA